MTPGYQKSYWDAHPDEYAAANMYDMVRPPDPYGYEGQGMKFKMQGLQDIANDPYRPPAAKAAATAQIHQMLQNLGAQSSTAAQVAGHAFGTSIDAASKSQAAQYAHWAQMMGLPSEIGLRNAQANHYASEANKGYALGDQGMVMNGKFYPNPGKVNHATTGGHTIFYNDRTNQVVGTDDQRQAEMYKAMMPEIIKSGMFQKDMMGNIDLSSPPVQKYISEWMRTGQVPNVQEVTDPKTGMKKKQIWVDLG